MSSAGATQIGNDNRANVLPVKPASGPGFLGPNYSPADEMLTPAAVGVRRGGELDDVIGAVKGIIYYGDMMGFGEASSGFTRGMKGLRPLGVNYFINSGLQCSNGASMWEFVQTIPTGDALGPTVKRALKEVKLPALRGMAPGILEDAKSALNPMPVINAVVGSGYPQCRLVRMKVGDFDGKIHNVDGNLLVDPSGLLVNGTPGPGSAYYQDHWIQDRVVPPVKRSGESDLDQFLRGDQIQLDYDTWNKSPKIYRDDGCIANPAKVPKDTLQPYFCGRAPTATVTLPDGTNISAFSMDGSGRVPTISMDAFQDYNRRRLVKSPHALVSVTVAAISVLCLFAFLSVKKK
jgi:hypothetical protein